MLGSFLVVIFIFTALGGETSHSQITNERQPPFETETWISAKYKATDKEIDDDDAGRDTPVGSITISSLKKHCRYAASERFSGWASKKNLIQCEVSNARNVWSFKFWDHKFVFTCNCQLVETVSNPAAAPQPSSNGTPLEKSSSSTGNSSPTSPVVIPLSPDNPKAQALFEKFQLGQLEASSANPDVFRDTSGGQNPTYYLRTSDGLTEIPPERLHLIGNPQGLGFVAMPQTGGRTSSPAVS